MGAEHESGYREKNSTADRALAILQMFNDEKVLLTAAEVASGLGVARSTAYRYLQTLVQSTFLEEDPGHGFRLGARILELARLARRSHDLSGLSVPIMRGLVEECHQTVLLTKRIGPAIVCVEREEWAGQYVRLSYERGSLLSINAGASALILLAWMPEEQQRELLAAQKLEEFTPATLTAVDEVLLRLAQIRRDGFAVSHGEVDAEALGIAAPIFDAEGKVVAGLSIVLIESRAPRDGIQTLIDAVMSAAEALSQKVDLYSS